MQNNQQITEKFANRYGYSDVEPYEIIKVISGKTIEVRAMQAERDKSWQPEFDIGGFSAHCSNQREQKWLISTDPSMPVIRIRLQKNGTWKAASGSKFFLSDEPKKFYDYNF